MAGREGEHFALRGRQRIDSERSGLGCGAEPEPAKRMAIEFGVFIQFAGVAITAAVLLIDRKLQSRAAGKSGDRLRALEDGALLPILLHRDQ